MSKKIVHFKKKVVYSYKINKIRDNNIKIYYDESWEYISIE